MSQSVAAGLRIRVSQLLSFPIPPSAATNHLLWSETPFSPFFGDVDDGRFLPHSVEYRFR